MLMTLIPWEEYIDNTKKNKLLLFDATEESVLEVNTAKMLMLRYQKVETKHSINIAGRSFEDVVTFKYLGTTLTDQMCTHNEIKIRLI
jgi:hypothetical protein